MVLDLSAADIPVVIPFAASTDTVKAVRCSSRFLRDIGGSVRFSTRSRVRGAQISPRPCVAMKAMVSGVEREAALIRSASFSRPGSSETITRRPRAISATISSTVLNLSADMECYLLPRIRSNTLALWVYFRLAERKGIEANELIFFFRVITCRPPENRHWRQEIRVPYANT